MCVIWQFFYLFLGQYAGPNDQGYQNIQYQENGPAPGPFVQENQQQPDQGNFDFYIGWLNYPFMYSYM